MAVADHPHHQTAKSWWNGEPSLIGFARMTQIGLLRLLTTSSAMGSVPLTNREAWNVFEAFLRDERVRVFSELPPVDDLFRSYSGSRQASPKLWVDAYLAAFSTANDATLVTFDWAFSKYKIACRILQ